MRVCLPAPLNPEISAPGGVRSYVLGLAKVLAELGHEVSVIGAGPSVGLGYATFVSVTEEFPLSEYAFIRALFRWSRRTTTHCGGIIHGQRPDELYPFVGRSPRTGLVCTLHGDPARGVAQRRSLGRIVYAHAESHALSAAAQIISVTRSGLRSYVKRYPSLEAKSTVIPVGIDLKAFHPGRKDADRAALGLGDEPTLLFAGRLESEKRVDILLEAAATLGRRAQVLVAGNGTMEPELRRRYSSGNIRFLGSVAHERMPTLYSAADVLVVSSEYEGLPTATLEALACGTPVIATRVGDIADLILEGKNGYTFDGTVRALSRVLEKHLGELAFMRDACTRTGQEYGWDKIVGRVIRVYERARDQGSRSA